MLTVVRGVARLCGIPRQRALDAPRERVASMLKSASAEGAFSGVQSSLADRALAFGAATVALEMVPWSAVHKIHADTPRHRLPPLFSRAKRARYPVVDASGRVLGVLDQLDAHLDPAAAVRDLITAVPRLAPTDLVHEALITIRAARARLAVVERHGRPVGLVTPKDLFEPLVGELESW
ncbi:MAG: CBS domain-containing protein [Phycisphaerales bacterium]